MQTMKQVVWYNQEDGSKAVDMTGKIKMPEGYGLTPPDIPEQPDPNDIPLWDVDTMVTESPTLAKYFLKSQGIE
ncbi:hypothetical protein [Desulfoluna spongiiphila]|uniref:Uncharacterized protein n=1 Tax=Desulfoluna spongiiphila TaxID=419481 RepID=A0A1G5JIY4_9BACT|nr:hypothetical protein [Desulfoluna spongiiphila]SCY88352.1 hypothetical protein SAMN05216233_13216 [Desulfoluna spongiiphila]